MKKAVLVFSFLFLLSSLFAASQQKSTHAIIRLLNSRAAGSPKEFNTAASIVAKDASKGEVLQQYVIAVFSSEDSQFEALRLSPEMKETYLANSRPKIQALAEKKSNALALYLLSIEKNDKKLLKRAAEGGNIQALNAWGTICLTEALGNLEYSDEEKKTALTRAMSFFKRAAEQKDANGLYNLGMCYMQGFGCDQDKHKAFDCFRAAAELGHPEAINNLGGFCRDGIVVEKDLPRATRWFAKSASLGNAYGKFNYALALQRGEGTEKDLQKAITLLKESSKDGCIEALNAYGMCLMTGDGVEKNEVEAVMYYKKAASFGFPLAMENLATCYDLGLGGLTKNIQEATVWKVRARAARGDRNAMVWLEQNGHSLR